MAAIDRSTPRFLAPALCLLMAALAMDCATTSQPQGWLSPVDVQDSLGFGGWARVWLLPQPGTPEAKAPAVAGELIAVSPDTIHVLPNDTLLRSLPVSALRRLELTAYDANAVPLNLWYLGGAVLTPAHGWFAIFELPLWILVGGIATLAAPNVSEFDWSRQEMERARYYARFPQGLPPGLDRTLLKPKCAPPGRTVATHK